MARRRLPDPRHRRRHGGAVTALGCQSQNCPFRFRRGVYHCGPCHCLDDIPIEIQSRTSSTQDAWKAGAKLAGDRTEDA